MRMVLAVFVAIAAAAYVIWFILRRSSLLREGSRLQEARQEFHRRREWLEAEFLKRAGSSGMPRGLAWADCEFQDEVTFARDRSNGELRALVGVTISFSAIPGGGMEEVEAVKNLRSGTAVFSYHARRWSTSGRAVFNLNPVETIRHCRNELELVE